MNTVGIIIDVVLVLVLLIYALIGFKKGLFKSVLSFFNWFVCIIVAFFLAKYVARWLNNIGHFNEKLGAGFSKALMDADSNVYSKSVNSFASKDALLAAITGTNLTGILGKVVNIIFKNVNIDMTSTDTLANVAGSSLGYLCMVAISAILVFIVLKIVLAILNKIFDKLARTKVIGGLNKFLGLLFGALKAALIIFVVNFLLVGLTLIPVVNKTVTPLVTENTKVERFVYNTTDKVFEKYIIEGDIIKNWINDLWASRG